MADEQREDQPQVQGANQTQAQARGPYYPEPALQQIASSETLPSVYVGTDPAPAGPWAEYAKRAKWRKAIINGRPKSDFLAHLLAMPSVNEPILRPGAQSLWSPSLFHDKIGESLANVEAILIQVVGTLQEVPCQRCQERRGPFSHCIRIPGANNQCGNCHWGGNRGRCSFNGAPPVPNPTRVRRPRLTNEQLRGYQERLDAMQGMMAELMGRLSESRRALVDLNRRITAYTMAATQPHLQPASLAELMNSFSLYQLQINEISGLVTALNNKMLELMNEPR